MNNFKSVRIQSASTKLRKEVFLWWLSLPNDVRPAQLAKAFPHIVNAVAETWDDFYVCEQYLHNLLHERERAYRRGFSQELTDEIKQLYNTLLRKALIVSAARPTSQAAWL